MEAAASGSPIDARFAIEGRVGAGAFGEVLRATDRATGEPVAIKRLHAHVQDATALERLRLEAAVLARVASPHVVRYVTHGPDAAGRLCLVLEWLEGEDLGQRQRSRPLAARDAVLVVRHAALGLAALHAAGVVHRDVKPSNIFLSETPAGGVHARLIDLGIARAAQLETGLTLDGARIGTPAYMAPEQARGEATLSVRVDQFALGVVLYELLAGRRPFTAADPYALLAKIVLHAPPPLDQLAPGVPPELAAIVARAMAKDPADRFGSIEEMAAALALVGALSGAAATQPAVADDATTYVGGSHETSGVVATHEQRVVTALFVGFAPGAAAVDPELDALAAIVGRYGGTTHPLLGRRAVAVFGLERAYGDEALRAARAAVEAQRAIAGLRAALTTCRAFSGAAALPEDAIERGAGHLERAAAGGEPVVDAATARLLESAFVLESTSETGVSLLRGPRAPDQAVGPPLLGRRTATVGRDRELGVLDAVLAECQSEPVARAVVVTGAAGAGKSRVRAEFLARAARAAPELAVFVARSDAVAAAPFGMLAAALRRAAGVLDNEPQGAQRDKLAARVARHVAPAERARVAAFLGEMVGVPAEPPAGTALSSALAAARADPITMGDAMRAAWVDWLAAECGAQPGVLLVLEDLQWADLPTVQFVDAALARLREAPFMVLALARPEVHERFPGLWSRREPVEVRLAPLTRKACARIVREAAGDALDEDTVARIVERADGNAFFLEELIRAVAEPAAGAPRAGATPRDGALPATILGAVQARLDALGAEAKRLLRVASVTGRAFWRGALAHLLGGDDATLGAALEQLAAREVILRRDAARFAGETEYVFRHALVREAAYAMLTDADRAAAHRLAGAWLEQAGERDAAVLAEHFDAGGDPASALPWFRRAAEQALEANDLLGAVARAERARACADAAGIAGETRAAASLIAAEANRWRGDIDAAGGCAEAALADARPGSALWFRAASEMVTVRGRRGDYAGVAALVTRWRAQAPEPGAVSAAVDTWVRAATQHMMAGRHAEAAPMLAHVDALLAASDEPLETGAEARLFQLQSIHATLGGEVERGVELRAAALATFERGGLVRYAILQRQNLGYGYLQLGQLAAAERELSSAVLDAGRAGLTNVAGYATVNLAHVLAAQGRLGEARDAALRAREIGVALGEARLAGAAEVRLAMLAHELGDPAAAERHGREALRWLETTPSFRAAAHAALARGLLAQGRADEAQDEADEAARDQARAGYVEVFDAFVRLTCAEVAHAVGDAAGARAAIAAARDAVLAGAARVHDADKRRAFVANIPEHARTLALAAELLSEAPAEPDPRAT